LHCFGFERTKSIPTGADAITFRDASHSRAAKGQRSEVNASQNERCAGPPIATAEVGYQSTTVVEVGRIWLRRCELECLEASTTSQYEQHLRLHIAPFLGHVAVDDLTTPVVEAFKDHLLESRSRPLSRAVLTSLKGILKEAVRRGLVAHNAADAVQVRRKSRGSWKGPSGATAVEIPSKAEIRALLSKSREMYPLSVAVTSRQRVAKSVTSCWHPLVVTAIFTGMRCSELRGLTWDHIDLTQGMIEVRQRADFQGTMGPPKTDAGSRDIPMTPMVLNTLTAWKHICPVTPLKLVFPSRNLRIHSNSNIHKQCWRPLQLAAGVVKAAGKSSDRESGVIPKLKFHALRHAAASLFIEQGWTPKKVQTILGHSSIQVTFDTYGKLWKDTDGDREAMALLESRLLD
jgi:integrase